MLPARWWRSTSGCASCPASGCPSPGSWESYARVLKEWAEFLSEHGVGLFGSRGQLKLALGKYAEYRAAGPAERRFAATTWGRHMSVLSLFYRWAIDEGHAQAEPFTYRTATGAVRRDRPRGPGEPRGPPHPEAARDHQVPGTGLSSACSWTGCGDWDRTAIPTRHYRGRELARNAASRGAGAGDRDAAAGVQLAAGLGDPAAAVPPGAGTHTVPGAGRDREGAQVPYDLDLLRRPGSRAPLPGTGPSRD